MLGAADNRRADSLAARLRRKRFAFFLQLLGRLERPVSLLDVGGTEHFWNQVQDGLDPELHVTLLNVEPQQVSRPNFASVAGDARDLHGFGDGTFDVVFSNSLIEHFASFDEQRNVAREIQRVGCRYFVQTPNRHFPLEPHFLVPFFQYLPVAWRAELVHRFALGWHCREPERASARRAVETVRLLSRKEVNALFPGAQLYEERLLGLTKSFVAYEGWPPAPRDECPAGRSMETR